MLCSGLPASLLAETGPLRSMLVCLPWSFPGFLTSLKPLLPAGKTSTAPLETVKMQLVQSGDMTTWQAAQLLWRRNGAAAFFR